MWWDERTPGGRVRSLVFLGHPGPSMLVTAVFVAMAGLAGRAVPDALRIAQLVGIMLPIQLCIGVVNDVVDLPDDAWRSRSSRSWPGFSRGRPPRGSESRWARSVSGWPRRSTSRRCCSPPPRSGPGLAYDLGLRRTVLSWVPWWGGMAVLPLTAYASAGAIPSRLFVLVPLAALVALGLHLANALPDIDADRVAGLRSLPVAVGRNGAARAGPAALVLAGVVAWVAAAPLGRRCSHCWRGRWCWDCGVAVVIATRAARPFPILAVATAVFAVAWLASLPAS